MMAARYISLGIIIDDIVFPEGRTRMGVLGGGGPQTVWGMAVAARSGGEVGLVAGVGRDFDDSTLAPLKAMGIDLSGVHRTDLPTPRAWQLLEVDGRRTHVWRVDQATSDRQTHPEFEAIIRFYPQLEAIHWGIHPEAPHLSPWIPLQKHGVRISIEPFKGLKKPLSDEEARTLLARCDIYSPTWEEAVSIFGIADKAALLEHCRKLGGRILTLRKGPAGAEAWNLPAGEGVSVPAAPVRKVVDPVGAGDAFCGAFVVVWHETGDLAAAAVSASVAASYLVEQVGLPAQPPDTASLRDRREAVRGGLRHLSL
jgi:sugar/nucleoside kinase (ribokinase family)